MRVTRARGDEDGAVLVIVALLMVAFVGMLALVVDIGGLLSARRELVRAADAAALAAAQDCAKESPGTAAATAHRYADSNRSRLNRLIPNPVCESLGAGRGKITVSYDIEQDLFFAPILGLDDTEDVAGRATAIWGPAGSDVPVIPLAVSESVFDAGHPCALPFESVAEGTDCYMVYRFPTESASTFGWMNLATMPVDSSGSCPASEGVGPRLQDGIDNPRRDLPPLNWPQATYVCRVPGNNVGQGWQTLEAAADAKVIVGLPVYDPDPGGANALAMGGQGTHGSLYGPGGNLVKYDVVGYVMLQLDDFKEGRDRPLPPVLCPAATQPPRISLTKEGSPGPSTSIAQYVSTCESQTGFPVSEPPSVREVGSNSDASSTGGNPDFSYDASSATITWEKWPGRTTETEIDVTLSYQPIDHETCGSHVMAQTDKCLVAKWIGFTTVVSQPGSGADFGIRAVTLFE